MFNRRANKTVGLQEPPACSTVHVTGLFHIHLDKNVERMRGLCVFGFVLQQQKQWARLQQKEKSVKLWKCTVCCARVWSWGFPVAGLCMHVCAVCECIYLPIWLPMTALLLTALSGLLVKEHRIFLALNPLLCCAATSAHTRNSWTAFSLHIPQVPISISWSCLGRICWIACQLLGNAQEHLLVVL